MRKDIISKIHSYIREGRLTSRGATTAPELVTQWQCKEYPRMERIPLIKKFPTTSLGDALTKRESHPSKSTSHPLTLEDLPLLLSPLSQKEGSGHRHYPSGGALYPIETYLVSSFESNDPTVYHYHPKAHALEKLWTVPEDFDFSLLFNQAGVSKKIQAAFIFTACWERSAKKYGDFTYNLALLEAGHMAQNVLLAATELTIEICPMGGFKDSLAHEILDTRNKSEQAVYCLSVM
jgi:SagB-type dehydrogenase family enzyme